MSILTKSRLQALRVNRIIAPDSQDDIAEVYIPLQQPQAGGAGVGPLGTAITTANPTTPNANLVHSFTDYCRVRQRGAGDEKDFGGESVSDSPWKISFRYFRTGTNNIVNEVPRNARIRLQKPLRAASTAYSLGDRIQAVEGNPYFYTCIQAGLTGSGTPTWPVPSKGFDAGIWKASTFFHTGDTIAASGVRYRCTTSGTTSTTLPTFPASPAGTVTDGTAVWTLIDSVTDGTAVFQVSGKLTEYQVNNDSRDKTYGVLVAVACQRIEVE